MSDSPDMANFGSRSNAHPFGHSFAVAGVALLVVFAVLSAMFGPLPAEVGGYVMGRLAFPLVIAALIAALIARRSARTWQWWRYALFVVPVGLGLAVLLAAASV